MYFDDPVDAAPLPHRLAAGGLLSANSLALLFFGILPQPLMALCFAAIVAL
jgi:hypothetical protein